MIISDEQIKIKHLKTSYSLIDEIGAQQSEELKAIE